MAAPDRTPEPKVADETSVETDDTETTINAYSTSEEKLVFTESDNADGWIATDLAVEIER